VRARRGAYGTGHRPLPAEPPPPQQHKPREHEAHQAAPHPEDPPAEGQRRERDRRVDQRARDHHRPGEVPRVAGPDEDPVEREHGARRGERRQERSRADEQLTADAQQRPDARAVGAAVVGRGAQEQPCKRGAHARLRDHRPGGRAVEPPVQPVDEPELEPDVHPLGNDDHDERRPQVPDPAQEPLAGERDQRERQPERADPQVPGGEVGHLPGAAEQRDERPGEHDAAGDERGPEREGQPQRLRGQPAGCVAVARAMETGHLRRRSVREEDAQ
jgi:hypothetical protein